MSYNQSQISKIKKCINAIKNFRPKCGKLIVNAIYDAKTQEALSDFISACKKRKLLDFFKHNPSEVLTLTDFILKNCPNNNSLIRSLYLYYRKDFQRIIWLSGIEFYLKKNGYSVAAEMLAHSLQTNPSPIDWFGVTDASVKIKGMELFKEKINKEISDKCPVPNPTAYFTGKFGLNFNSKNNNDLYYSLGKVDVTYTARFHSDRWIFECKIEDRYDFDEFRSTTLTKVFKKGLKATIKDNAGPIANNMGLLSQIDGVITPYDVTIIFTYDTKEDA